MLEYLITGIIVIILLVTIFILTAILPKHKYYFDSKIYPNLTNLNNEESFNIIKNECKNIQDTFIIYSGNRVNEDHIKLIPETYNLLRTIQDIRHIFITVLKPKTKTTRHKGSADISNNTLRSPNNSLLFNVRLYELQFHLSLKI